MATDYLLDFDGVDDQVKISNISVPFTDTSFHWVGRFDVLGNGDRGVFQSWIVPTEFIVWWDASAGFQLFIRNNNSDARTGGIRSGVSTETFYHIEARVINGVSVELIVKLEDGTLINSQIVTTTESFNPIDCINLGDDDDGLVRKFDGALKSFNIYDNHNDTLLYDYKASNSNGTGLTLSETNNGPDAILLGYSNNYSHWIPILYALEFNGSNEYALTSTYPVPSTWEVEVEVRIRNIGATDYFFGFGSTTDNDWINITNSFQTRKLKISSSGQTPGNGSTNLENNQFYNLKLSWDGVKYTLLIDDALEYSVTPNSDFNSVLNYFSIALNESSSSGKGELTLYKAKISSNGSVISDYNFSGGGLVLVDKVGGHNLLLQNFTDTAENWVEYEGVNDGVVDNDETSAIDFSLSEFAFNVQLEDFNAAEDSTIQFDLSSFAFSLELESTEPVKLSSEFEFSLSEFEFNLNLSRTMLQVSQVPSQNFQGHLPNLSIKGRIDDLEISKNLSTLSIRGIAK